MEDVIEAPCADVVSAGEVSEVLQRLREGRVLHRIASERDGHYWMLMPGEQRIPNAIAEFVASKAGVVSEGAPVGRISWKVEDGRVVRARAKARRREATAKAKAATG